MNPIEQTFAAFGDATRMAIIEKISRGESSLSDIAKPFHMSQTAVSKHVKILSEAGLVEVSKRGRTRYCKLKVDPLQQAEQWLETYQQFWAQRFDNLTNFLDEETQK